MDTQPKPVRYFLYARKSSEDKGKQVQSIEDQVNELRRIAKQRELLIIDELYESQSAKQPGRPIFNKMMERIAAGEADGILCWKLDRLSRNPVDGGTVSWWLQNGTIKSIQTFEKEHKPSDNVLMMAVELGMANQFIRDLVPNVLRGMESKVKKGWFPHRVPPGYLNDKYLDRGERTISPDPDRFEMVKKMWKMVAEQVYTPAEVLWMANEEWGFKTLQRKKSGGGPLSNTSFYDMLRNPFFYGSFLEKGVLYEGKHRPMVSEELYWKVQKVLGKKGRPCPKTNRTYYFGGRMRCGECGYAIIGEMANKISKKTGERFLYCRCSKKSKEVSCTQKYITEAELKKQLDEFIQTITLKESVKDWCLKWLKEENADEEKTSNQIVESLNRTYEQNQKWLFNLNSALIEERMSKEEHHQRTQKLLLEQKALRKQLDETEVQVVNWLELCERTFDFAVNCAYWFNNGTIEDKKIILATIGSEIVLKDKIVTVKPGELFEIIQEGVKTEEWCSKPCTTTAITSS